VHWNTAEAEARAAALRTGGYEVDATPMTGAALREMDVSPPDALVIDLSRAPSQGRDVALAVRLRKATRSKPIVFVDGDPSKVAAIEALLPDAAFTTWGRALDTLRRAIAEPPRDPVRPASGLAGYSGTPLPKKLGIKPGSVVVLHGAPTDVAGTLGDLPTGATLRRSDGGHRDLTLWFVRTRADLERGIARMARLGGEGGLWILWRKKAAAPGTDLSEAIVRQTGLAAGLVDFKICAFDAVWSGLRFSLRRRP